MIPSEQDTERKKPGAFVVKYSLVAPGPRALLSFLVPLFRPFRRADGSVKFSQRFARFRALTVFCLTLVELVVSRVAVLGLVRLRKSRIERRRLQLFIRARVRLVSPRTSRTSITHRSHASKSSLSRLSRRLASSRAHLERRLLRRRLRRRLDRLHRAARSSVSHPRSRTRARAHHHRSHRARLPRSNARRPIPPLSRFRDLRRSPRPSSHPSRARLPRFHPSVASSRAHLHHRLHRVRSHRLFARHRPSSAARRARGSSTRSVGRSRTKDRPRSRFFRVSFA